MVADITNYLDNRLRNKVALWVQFAAKRGVRVEYSDAYQDAALATLRAVETYVPDSNISASLNTYLERATDNALARHIGARGLDASVLVSLDAHPYLMNEDAVEDFHFNLFLRDLTEDETLLFRESIDPSAAIESALGETGEHRDSGTGGIASAMMKVHGFSKRRVLKTMGGLRAKLEG